MKHSFQEFLEYGLVSVDENTNCFLWNKSHFTNGYGRYMSTKRAHRVSWELVNGSIPKGFYILHRCDVRECVNPEHLFIGSQKDNMQDMISKGRKVVLKGKDSYFASLDFKQRVSGENHWTNKTPESIAKGERHWSKIHPEKFAKTLAKIHENKRQKKKGSEGQ